MYSSQSSATEHAKSFHRGRRFTCPDRCGKNFAYRYSALSHAESVHRGIYKQFFYPEGCGKAFSEKGKASTHASVAHHKHRVSCSRGCGKTFTQKHTAKVHVRTVHDKVRFPCPDSCGMTFARPSHARPHLKQKHGKGNRKFPCTGGCDKNFTSKGDAQRHGGLCRQDKMTEHICTLPRCINTFRRQPLSKECMDQHMRKHKNRGHLRGLDGSATPGEVIVSKICQEGDSITADTVQEGDTHEAHDTEPQADIAELPPYSFSNWKSSVQQQDRDELKNIQ